MLNSDLNFNLKSCEFSSANSAKSALIRPQAFTLVELLVSMTILTVLMLLISSVLGSVQTAWRQASSKVSQFREARRAFDRMYFSISQAMMNNYTVYQYQGSSNPLVPPSKGMNSAPKGYLRFSDLQFVCGQSSFSGNSTMSGLTGLSNSISPGHAMFFQAPLGRSSDYRLPSGLNGCGYFIKFADDAASKPPFLLSKGVPSKSRYRLYEYMPNVESNSVYADSIYSGTATSVRGQWYADFDLPDQSRPIANNIVMLVISPSRSEEDNAAALPTDIAPDYYYDTYPKDITKDTQEASDFQLPPFIKITMVAIDEASAEKIALSRGETTPQLSSELSDSLFTKAKDYRDDIAALEASLVTAKVNFRIFSATIPIRASKWGQGT